MVRDVIRGVENYIEEVRCSDLPENLISNLLTNGRKETGNCLARRRHPAWLNASEEAVPALRLEEVKWPPVRDHGSGGIVDEGIVFVLRNTLDSRGYKLLLWLFLDGNSHRRALLLLRSLQYRTTCEMIPKSLR